MTSALNADLATFADLVHALASDQDWLRRSQDEWSDLVERLSRLSVLPAEPRDLTIESQGGIPSGLAGMALEARFVFLRPAERQSDWLPAFSVRIEGDWNNVRLFLAMFRLDTSADLSRVRAVGIRFETPESGATTTREGRHDFYHAQFWHRLRGTRLRLPELEWIPETQPSLPVSATGPLELLLALMVSVYGLNEAAREWDKPKVRLATQRGRAYVKRLRGSSS